MSDPKKFMQGIEQEKTIPASAWSKKKDSCNFMRYIESENICRAYVYTFINKYITNAIK